MNPYREAALLLRGLRGTNEEAYQAALANLTEAQLRGVHACWQLHARSSQLRPAASRPIWLRSAGRGEGKTRSAAEENLDVAEDWGAAFRGILISRTIADVRDVMIQGESGLIACAQRRGYTVKYVANRGCVEFPGGGIAYVLSSEEPEKPRGYQSNYVWGDEIAKWKHALESFDNVLFGWRLKVPGGWRPRMILTSTPKPNPIMFRLFREPKYSRRVTVTFGSTRDNRDNLDPDSYEMFDSIYGGTRQGRQEMEGELLDGLGAVFEQDTIAQFRVDATPELARRVVALDPSITANEDSDAAGIVVVGSDWADTPHAYLLDDRTLETATFGQWARAAVDAFVDWNCDCVVAEVNQGGGGIEEAIQVAAAEKSRELGYEVVVPVRSVWARESKRARAEPCGALYERGRVHHVGHFKKLEDEITGWMPGMRSPNRMDALVHGITHLLLAEKASPGLAAYLS